MTTHHGKNGVVKIGANSVAEVKDFSYDRRVDISEDSAMGDTHRSGIPDIIQGDGSVTCHYDPSDANGQESMDVGAALTLLLYPEDGDGTGETELSVPCHITRKGIAVQRGDITEVSFDFQQNGAETEGTAT